MRPQVLKLSSGHGDPADVADEIVDQLLATPPEDWVARFGERPL